MDILEQIIAYKKEEVAERKSLYPEKLLEKSIYFPTPKVSLRKYLLREDKSGIIAEIKRKSPSKGLINKSVSVERTSIGYMQAGASALSVLTDEHFFGGRNEDLTTARKYNFCPILRKDFIVDEYQIIEAKSIGADAILLIAAAMDPKRLKKLAEFASKTGLEILMEVHSEAELESHLNEYVTVVGVNNRNLKTFETHLKTSLDLAEKIPGEMVKISESGISNAEAILRLKEYGYQGFLIGEYFMAHNRPGAACADFIRRVALLEKQSEPMD